MLMRAMRPLASQYHRAPWVGTKRIDRFPIRELVLGRNERPSSDELILERFLLTDTALPGMRARPNAVIAEILSMLRRRIDFFPSERGPMGGPIRKGVSRVSTQGPMENQNSSRCGTSFLAGRRQADRVRPDRVGHHRRPGDGRSRITERRSGLAGATAARHRADAATKPQQIDFSSRDHETSNLADLAARPAFADRCPLGPPSGAEADFS